MRHTPVLLVRPGRALALLAAVLLIVAAGAALTSAPVAAQGPANLVINEYLVNHVGRDTNEFVELYFTANTDLSAYSILQIEGDGTSAGIIDRVFTPGTTNAAGIWVTGFQNNILENGTMTLLLVTGFTGAVGDDVDSNNDGVLNTTVPWTSIIDSVGFNDGGANDRTYPGSVGVVFTSGGLRNGGSRIPNGTDTNAAGDWVQNDFDGAGITGFTGSLVAGEALNTPGAVNTTEAAPVDVAPTVSSVSPTDGATNVAASSNITITFSEAVTVTDPWVSVSCHLSGTQTTVITGGPTTFTINPDASLPSGESCTVMVTAANVSDQNGTANAMAADFQFAFQVAAPVACGSFTPIYSLQEGGASFGSSGSFTVEGIVTGDFQETGELDGFYIQDTTGDANPLTSDGIFVYDPAPVLLDVVVGQRVRVTGTVTEWLPNVNGVNSTVGQTEINATAALDCGTTGTITPVALTLPLASLDMEQYESMLLSFTQTLTVNDTFRTGRYGTTTLSSGGRLFNPTQITTPGAAANAQQAANDLNTLLLDDGSDTQNPDPAPYLFNEPTLRSGYTTGSVVGVLGHTDSTPGTSSSTNGDPVEYRLYPTAPVSFSATPNPRPTAPPAAGTVRVISFNVLNYFNGNGAGGGFPTSRGADSQAEFVRQSDKIVAAITALNPAVAGLIELENDTGASGAQQELVNRLNTVAGPGSYAIIDTGVTGTDEIKVGFIYRPEVVTPVGSPIIDTDDPIHNRPPVAQEFSVNANGATFVAVVNHFKSKGCGSATGLDLDQGDGQGCYNNRRTQQATRLAAWLSSTVFTATGERDVLVLGDLNAYAMEDPITTLVAAGYADQAKRFDANAYGYVFDGQSGTLDYALASTTMASQIVNASEWHINADEPIVLDYNTEFKSDAQDALNVGTAYRSSDHDPVVVDITPTTTTSLVIDDNGSGTVFADTVLQVAEGAQVSDRFTISLPFAPMAPVTVTLTTSSTADVRIVGGARWFPVLTRNVVFQPDSDPNDNVLNWDDKFTVSITGLEDSLVEGMETHQILFTAASSDPAYNGLALTPRDVQVFDAGVNVTPTVQAVNENSSGSFSVVLTAPPGLSLPTPAPETVTVAFSQVSGTALTGLPMTLTFTRANWNVPQVVNFSTPDDGISNPLPYQAVVGVAVSSNITTLDSRYGGIGANVTVGNLTVTINDDDFLSGAPELNAPTNPQVAPLAGPAIDPAAVEILPEAPGS